MRKNHKLALDTLAHIAANTDSWNQSNYRTCFAGQALRLSGYELREVNPDVTVFYDPAGRIVENGMEEARAELGFTFAETQYVFLFMPNLDQPRVSREIQFAELTKRVHEVLANDNDTDFPL